jgi:hypothetical protein
MSNWMAISSTQRHSEPLRGHQRSSEALRGTQRHSKALRGTQTQSEAIRRNQRQSEAIRGHSAALRGHRDPRRPSRTQIASAIIGGATAARAPVCCAIVVRTSPSLSPLTTLAPPPSFSACLRRRVATRRPTSPIPIATPRSRPSSRAARCARFACNQRVLSGHSEGTQRALRGHRGHSVAIHPRALRGQSAARREAIRGERALRGTHRPSEGTQRPSLAIIRNQQHSGALSGNQEGAGTQDGHDGHIAC